jgi:hypothetical protein
LNRPWNASAASVPDASSLAAQVLQRRGLLSQGAGAWGEVVCIDAEEGRLYLAPLRRDGSFSLAADRPAAFQLTDASGLVVVTGLYAGAVQVNVNGVPQEAFRLDVLPDGVERRNRRDHFRVTVTLKGELLPLGPREIPDALRESWSAPVRGSALPHLESLARSLSGRARPCVLKDLSLGGARVALASPSPSPGEKALLHIALEAGEAVRNLPCAVVQSRPAALAGPLDALVRMRFIGLAAPVEGRLGRYIARVPVEQLKRGVRS